MEHRELWGEEQKAQRYTGVLDNLTSEELELFDGLKGQRWGKNLRLEQERLPFELLLNLTPHLTP